MRVISVVVVLAALTVGTTAAAETDPDARPKALGFGIGGGITLPQAPFGLDTMSARLRVNDYLTLEPLLGFTSVSGTTVDERANGKTETKSAATELVAEVNGRYRLGKRTRVEPQVLGGLGYRKVTSETDPDGGDNTSSLESTSLFVQWGFGLECYLGPHWSVSADGTNPLFTDTTSVETREANDTVGTTSSRAIGLAWDPAVRFQVHLYL